MKKLHVKTGDTVEIISGDDKGKKGKVLDVSRDEGKIIVEKLGLVTKHVKPRSAEQQGGRVQAEAPFYASKAMLVCPKCGKKTRVAVKVFADGTKKRICKNPKCGETF